MTTLLAPVPPVERLLGQPTETPPDQDAGLADVAEIASAVTRRQVPPGPVVVTTVPYAYGSPATGGLFRVGGQDADGKPWSLFVKVLNHVRHWPGLPSLPPATAAQFAADFPWRDELDLFTPEFAERLPTGLRIPRLGRLADLGDDRLAVWMEDVAIDPVPWSVDRFARAAWLLGRFAARGTAPELLARSGYPSNFALKMYAEGAVPVRGLAPLADDALWSRPRLVGEGDLRYRLGQYGDRMPELLARLDALPQAMHHGDASPQNLLVPADGSADFVLIDISFTTPHALGFDLGQLMVGLVHADLLAPDRLPEIAAAIVPAYAAGLAEEGVPTSLADVRLGFAASVLIRSGLDSMRYDLVDADDDDAARTFANRVGLTRFLLDLADGVL